VFSVQLDGDWFSGGSPPSKLLHDGSFFGEIFRHIISHGIVLSIAFQSHTRRTVLTDRSK
jgi:hypothetical protein